MTGTDLESALRAYRGGLKADMIQGSAAGGEWGPIFCLPPCSPNAMERAATQFVRGRAQVVRHCRRAHLRGPSSAEDVVVVTVLPARQQTVARLDDGVMLRVVYLEDDALATLDAAFVPSAPHP